MSYPSCRHIVGSIRRSETEHPVNIPISIIERCTGEADHIVALLRDVLHIENVVPGVQNAEALSHGLVASATAAPLIEHGLGYELKFAISFSCSMSRMSWQHMSVLRHRSCMDWRFNKMSFLLTGLPFSITNKQSSS